MFQRRERKGQLIGYSLEYKNIFFFFGSRYLSREQLWDAFPEFEFSFLKQVHGKTVVEADPDRDPEADAHYTRRVTRAPVVQTADCVPVLLASRSQVCSVHAGWRGVAQNIIGGATAAFVSDPVLFAAIGPHILRPNFEVGADVAEQLLAAVPPARGDATATMDLAQAHETDAGKRRFDLTSLVRLQLEAALGPQLKVFECLRDTKTCADFFSFRRDREAAGRQFSFVVINA